MLKWGAFITAKASSKLMKNIIIRVQSSLKFEISIYRKVASRSTSWLVAHPRIIRLFLKGKFDSYVLWPLTKKDQKVNSSLLANYAILTTDQKWSKVHSFLKQCCAQSSAYQNKVLVCYSWLIGFIKTTLFWKSELRKHCFKNEWILVV